MNKKGILCLFVAGFVGGMVLLGISSLASAIDLVLEPANTQRNIGDKVRVHIYADSAVDLISMGVYVSFDPAILQVDVNDVDGSYYASKYEADADTGWVMDADGDPATTGDQYKTPAVEIDNTNGSVTMIGGNLKGMSTTGHSGKVLLGWIVFEAVGNGNSNLNVDLGKYHPNHPDDTFDNFVRVNGTVDEPANVPDNLGTVCVTSGACTGDINANGSVDMGDFAAIRAAMGQSFPASGYDVAADVNANGSVDMGDFAIIRAAMGDTCPACP